MPGFRVIACHLLILLALVGWARPVFAQTEADLIKRLNELYVEAYTYHEEAQGKIDQLYGTIDPKQAPRAFIKAYALATLQRKKLDANWTFDKVRTLAIQIRDEVGLAELLFNRGMEMRDQEPFETTIETFKAARTAAKHIGDPLLEGLIVSEIANTYCIFNIRKESAEQVEESLALMRSNPQHPYALAVRSTVGTILSLLYRKEESIRLASVLFEELKNLKMYYAASIEATNIGIRYRDKNQPEPERAIAYFDEAIALGQLAGDRDAKATALNAQGALYLKVNPRRSIQLLEEARLLFRQGNDVLFEAEATLVLVEAYINDHNPRQARKTLADLPQTPSVRQKHTWYVSELESRIAAEEGDFETAFRIFVKYHNNWLLVKNSEEQEELSRLSTQLNLKLEEEKNLALALDLQKSLREKQLLISVLLIGALIGGAMLWGLVQGRQIKQQKKLLQDIMDNVNEGILRFGPDRLLEQPYARQLEHILGRSDLAGVRILDLLFSDHPDQKSFLETCLDAVFGEKFETWDFNASHFPEEIIYQQRTLHLLWHPIVDSQQLIQHMMLIVRDNTEQKLFQISVAQERAQTDQRNRRSIELRHADITRTEAFLLRLQKNLLKDINKQSMHTWKGEARTLGLMALAEHIHAWEQEPGESLKASFEQLVASYQAHLAELVIAPQKSKRSGVLEICTELCQETRQRLALAGIGWGPLGIHIDLDGENEDVMDCIRPILLHGLSNAVDHGFLRSAPTFRQNRTASFTIMIERLEGQLHVSVEDNGQGIDWAKVRSLANDHGIVSENKQDLIQVLFREGTTTADQVSLTSGRGVGLSAIQSLSHQWGGRVSLMDAEQTSGTRLEVYIPWPLRKAA